MKREFSQGNGFVEMASVFLGKKGGVKKFPPALPGIIPQLLHINSVPTRVGGGKGGRENPATEVLTVIEMIVIEL